jgi:hypothetical protein
MEFTTLYSVFYSVAVSNLMQIVSYSVVSPTYQINKYIHQNNSAYSPLFFGGNIQATESKNFFPSVVSNEVAGNDYSSFLLPFPLGVSSSIEYDENLAIFSPGFTGIIAIDASLTRLAQSAYQLEGFSETPAFLQCDLSLNYFIELSQSTLIPAGIQYQSPADLFYSFVGIGVNYNPIFIIPDSLMGAIFSTGYAGNYPQISDKKIDLSFYIPSVMEILFGNGSYQNENQIIITAKDIGIKNTDSIASIFAGILFNSLYAFDSTSNINSILWENIKSIKENGKRYLYGVIILNIKEEFNA